ncbi:hypothetical protein GCM10023148_26340 [Actinokineospora soli]
MSIAALLNSSPAHAASGGGCGAWDHIDPCVSFSGSYIYADFYMNVTPDSSRCLAVLQIWKNGSLVKSQSYSLTRTGRYGPISNYAGTGRGSAYSKLHIYTCSNVAHYSVTSPTLYWP